MAEPIAQPNTGANLLTQLLGQQQSGSSNQSTQQLVQALTQAMQSGTSSATTTNTAELGPLLQSFLTSSQGMTPEAMQTLISSIFTEGARAVPELTGQFANSTGSRVRGNSGLNLALGDLNRNLSTQAASAILQNNQQSQATAASIAANIANATRQTQQTGTNASTNTGTSNQTQTGNTSSTSKQASGINPSMAGLVGAGGTALNWLDKKGAFDKLFGRVTPAAGGVGAISGANPTPISLTNGGGASTLGAPAASQGLLSAPVSSNPYGFSSAMPGAGFATGAGGITGFGGFGASTGGGLGTLGTSAFGSLPTSFDAFGTAGTESLGSNLNFGSNPFGYTPDGGGITGVMSPNEGWGGAFTQGIGNAVGDFGGWLGGLAGGAADLIGSLFADGGLVGPRTAYADGGQIETGGTARVRNQNYLGPRQSRQQEGALNYDGYATTGSVGASQPAGGSPSLSLGVTPGSGNSASAADLARRDYAEAIARGEQMAAMFVGQGGGSGGIGEGAAPSQNEAENGQAGIGPSGIAAAPPGTGQAAGLAAGMAGMPAPGLSSVLGLIAAIAAAVNAANAAAGGGAGNAAAGIGETGAVTSPVSQSTVTGINLGPVGDGTTGGGGVGASGGPGSGSDGGPGDSGVGGDSAGDGSSGSAGTSAGGDGWKDGGLVRGPGTGTSDSIPVKSRQPGGKQISYSDGEYVIPADVVAALGVNHFDQLLQAFHTPAGN